MKLFDTVQREDLDRREFHLLVLAIGSILLLAIGLALVAYPLIFYGSVVLVGWTPKVCFFGFCGLCALLVGYLWERYQVVCGLRRQVETERRRYLAFRCQSGRDLLGALAGFSQFQDRLVMEYRRAVNLSDSLSLLVIKLTPAPNITEEVEIISSFGDAAKAIGRKIRREDSLYHFCSGGFGAILTGTTAEAARNIAARVEEGLRDAAGAANRFSFVVKVFNYPLHAATAHELESAVRSMLPIDLVVPIIEPSLVGADSHAK
jgi:GGDEF domain-containing protein